METKIIQELAYRLDAAVLGAMPLPRLSLEYPELSLEDAYQIQSRGIDLRRRRGESVIGYKMGLTSSAKMKQMGVTAPIAGVLTQKMRIELPRSFLKSRAIHPKIEPEIAVILAHPIHSSLSFEEAVLVCASIGPAAEIIDSRFENFKFTLPDVVADNCSSSSFVLGKMMPFPLNDPRVSVDDLKMTLSENNEVLESGNSGSILGHPIRSIVALSQIAAAQGWEIPGGSIVLCGSATAAIPLEKGKFYRVSVEGFEEFALRTE